ncbi:hypothetical protein [Achromobacter xylosoxidans]|uniref:hypothetical protein n=1 Tax=Alcaligenes xylosoxydans xylosoxydans TaxID=85698 RepID=UPI0006C4446B|nr:hypothetical protein [Achromobacter xylosoxidans]CUI28457.1 Uncharacterised protein [Achromobacter xylosoxidans]
MILFPQLPHHIALQIATAARSASVQSLAGTAAFEHPACEYTPTGGTRATAAALNKLRGDLLQIATTAGYPSPAAQQQAAAFDAEAALVLAEQMGIAPAEAAKGGVWEFLSCVLLPDIVRWRFGGTGGGATPLERFVSGRRNVFQRLWWRAFHLAPRAVDSPLLPELLRALGEDELVQLMERPSLAGIEGLPGSIALGLLSASKAYSDLTRRQLIREAQKRFLRLSSFVSFESIASEEISHHVESVFEQVAASLPRQDSEPAPVPDHG